MQMTASNCPVSAARSAVTGISNAPGTRMTVMSSSRTEASASACRAPFEQTFRDLLVEP